MTEPIHVHLQRPDRTTAFVALSCLPRAGDLITVSMARPREEEWNPEDLESYLSWNESHWVVKGVSHSIRVRTRPMGQDHHGITVEVEPADDR